MTEEQAKYKTFMVEGRDSRCWGQPSLHAFQTIQDAEAWVVRNADGNCSVMYWSRGFIIDAVFNFTAGIFGPQPDGAPTAQGATA